MIFIISGTMCKFFLKSKEASAHNCDLHANTNSVMLLTHVL